MSATSNAALALALEALLDEQSLEIAIRRLAHLLRETTEQQQAQIQQILANLTSLQSQITSLTTQLQTSTANLQSQINAINTQLATIFAQLASLAAADVALQTQINAITALLPNTITRLVSTSPNLIVTTAPNPPGGTAATLSLVKSSAFVYNTAPETVPAFTPVTFNSAGVLTGFSFTPGTTTITCTIPGTYQFTYTVSPAVGIIPDFYLTQNGGEIPGSNYTQLAGTELVGICNATLAVGDTITLFNNSIVPAILISTGPSNASISIN